MITNQQQLSAGAGEAQSDPLVLVGQFCSLGSHEAPLVVGGRSPPYRESSAVWQDCRPTRTRNLSSDASSRNHRHIQEIGRSNSAWALHQHKDGPAATTSRRPWPRANAWSRPQPGLGVFPAKLARVEREPVESISAVTLLTADMVEAVAFYKALGFHLLYGGQEAPFTSFRVGAGYLNLQLNTVGSTERAVWGRVVLWVDDVDAMYRRALTAGFDPETSPADAPWGERYFHIHDPDGHELSFARPLTR